MTRVTKIQRERHTLRSEALYPQVMQRAFVVRLGPKTEPALGRFEGRVEEVETGEELRFWSAEELHRFRGFGVIALSCPIRAGVLRKSSSERKSQ